MGRSKELFEYLRQSGMSVGDGDDEPEAVAENAPESTGHSDPGHSDPGHSDMGRSDMGHSDMGDANEGPGVAARDETGSDDAKLAEDDRRRLAPIRPPEEVARAFAESHRGGRVPFLGSDAPTPSADHESDGDATRRTVKDDLGDEAVAEPLPPRVSKRESDESAEGEPRAALPPLARRRRRNDVAPALRAGRAARSPDRRGGIDARTDDREAPADDRASVPRAEERPRRRSRPVERAQATPVPRGAAKADKASAKRRRPEPEEFVSFDEPDPSRPSFGDQKISVTYNNAAILLLFFGSLIVLSYFLGFTQGIGTPFLESDPVMMGTSADGSRSDAWARRFEGGPARPGAASSAPGSAEEELGNGAAIFSSEGGADSSPSGGGGTESVLEGQQPFWTVRLFTAEPGQRTRVEHYLNLLTDKGYDARIEVDGQGRHILYAGRFDDRSAELQDLLAALRELELDSSASERGHLPPFHDAFAVFH